MPLKKPEFRSLNFELKDVKETGGIGRIEGYASVFGNLDWYLDIIDPGAFSKTIQESGGKVPVLADHMSMSQIGWGLTAKEDARGLFVTAEIDVENNQKGKEKWSLAKRAMEIQARMGLSIGFLTISEKPDGENPRIRHITEVKLMEYSLVAFPANTEAYVTAVKSWMEGLTSNDNLDDSIKFFLETMRKKGHTDHDVRNALLKSGAASEPEPLSLEHSFSRSIEQFKQSFLGTHSK